MSTNATGEISAQMGALDWAMLILLSLVWGGSFFFVGVAVAELPVLTIVALRVGLAAATLWLVVALFSLPTPGTREVWLAFLVMGLLNNVAPFGLIVWGQTAIGSGLASILNATTPLFTVAVAGAVLADERVSALRIGGVVAGFVGVAVMIGLDQATGLGADIPAQLAILGAALSYSVAGVYGRRFRRLGVDPVATAAGQVTASTLVLAPLALALEAPFALPAPSLGTWAAVAALAVPSTALAYILYFRLLARAGATNVLLVTFLVPVSAILLGALFLGERLGVAHAIGMALIGLGLSLIDGRLYRR